MIVFVTLLQGYDRVRYLDESGLLPIAAGLLILAIAVSFFSMPVVYFNYRGTEPPKGRLEPPFSYVEGFYALTGLAAIITGCIALVYRTLQLLGWQGGIKRDQLPLVDFDYTVGLTLIVIGILIWVITDRIFPRKR